jgi:hypothetical protein
VIFWLVTPKCAFITRRPIRHGSIRSKSGSPKSSAISLPAASLLRSKIWTAKSCAISAPTIAKPRRLNGRTRMLPTALNPLRIQVKQRTLSHRTNMLVSSSIPKAKLATASSYAFSPTACCNRSRKNVLSLSNVWLVFMPMNGLTFGTLASKLPGDFNFIQLKPDRRRRRNKFSDKLLFLAAKSELLPKGRSTQRIRSDAAYL